MFQELDRRPTPMGDISLRRRLIPTLDVEVYEVMLGDEHLMSSLFTAAEIALAELGLDALPADDTDLDVVVGGLGLGYTAGAVLADERVRRVRVVEALGEVIEWHRAGVLLASPPLLDDPRCEIVHGDFFAILRDQTDFGTSATPPRGLDAILVDIDHTPRHVLDASHASFYEPEGLTRVRDRLRPGGVFALWSDTTPDDRYLSDVESVFGSCVVHEVTFANPHTGGEAANAVVVAVSD